MEISSVDFKERIFDCSEKQFRQSSRPALVELYTDWCTACKTLNPVLEKLRNKYESIDVMKVDITFDDDLVEAFDIQSVPTMLFVRPNKGLMKKLVGAQTPATLELSVAEYLL